MTAPLWNWLIVFAFGIAGALLAYLQFRSHPMKPHRPFSVLCSLFTYEARTVLAIASPSLLAGFLFKCWLDRPRLDGFAITLLLLTFAGIIYLITRNFNRDCASHLRRERIRSRWVFLPALAFCILWLSHPFGAI